MTAPTATTEVRTSGGVLRTALSLGTYLLAQAAAFLGLWAVWPRQYYVDDMQAQYLPMFVWMARHSDGIRPPLISADMGMAGNLAGDVQYGVFSPVHWLLIQLVGGIDDLSVAAWVLGIIPTVILGTGVVLLLRRVGAGPLLSAATALGVASGGCILWFGASWWPLLWSTAFLPWLLLGFVIRRPWAMLVLAAATWLIGTGGYPYNIVFAAVTVIAYTTIHVWGRWRSLWSRDMLLRLGAVSAGAIASIAPVLNTVAMNPYTQRTGGLSGPLGNSGHFLPNFIDAALGGPTLSVNAVMYDPSAALLYAPVAALALFTIPALAFIPWRRAVTHPVFLTALILAAAGLAATQLPTVHGPFRIPLRYLAIVQTFLPIAVATGLARGAVLSRPRIAVAASTIAAMGALALFRTPRLGLWHVLGIVLVTISVAGLMTVASRRGVVRTVAGIAVLASMAAAPALGAGTAAAAALRLHDEPPLLNGAVAPAAPYMNGRPWGVTVDEYRERSLETDAVATVIRMGGLAVDHGWSDGYLFGNANLVADFLPTEGYTSIGHAKWAEHACLQWGYTDCQGSDADIAIEPETGTRWIELMSADRVYLTPGAPESLVAALKETRTESMSSNGAWLQFDRREPAVARVAWVSDEVEVSAADDSGDDRYVVTTPPGGGTIVLRTPWWPGYVAVVDGQEQEVRSIDGTVVAIDLQGDLDGATVELRYEPIGERVFLPSLAAATIVLLTVVVLSLVLDRRARRRENGLHADETGSTE